MGESDKHLNYKNLPEKSLSEVEILRSTLTENLPYPTMLIRKDRNILFANKVAREVGAVVGGQCWQSFAGSDYISDKDKACLAQHQEEATGGIKCSFCLADDAFNESKTLIASDIRAFGGIWEIYWIPVSKDVFLHYTIDVTERKQAETDLMESHERFMTVMNSIDALIYVADFDTHEVLYINQYGRDVWGDVVGEKCWQSLQNEQAEPCEFCTNDCLLDENGKPAGVHTREQQNTSNHRWYESHGQAIQWTDGRFVRMMIATDITSRKETEQEKQYLMDSLSEKTKEMERLLRIVSHDLRSPLVNIHGFSQELVKDCQQVAEIIRNVEMDEQTKKSVSVIANEYIPESTKHIQISVKKMDILLKGISRLSKVGRVELDIEPLDMNEMMDDIIESENFRTQRLHASVECKQLPSCLGDKARVNQIFSNLLDNSLKYLDPSRDGYIEVSATVENGRCIYCVKDNGIGIPKSHKSKVFEIFHRVDPEAKVKGEGLGLTTVKQIVERLNGSIWLESESGHGSSFFVSLPAVPTVEA